MSKNIKTYSLLALLLISVNISACAQDKVSSPVEVLEKEMTDAQADAWFEQTQDDGKVSLTIGDTTIRVEYADTAEKRQLGLMFRRELCEDCGMLFKFDSERIGSIWMKNTFIPLDLAYITKEGEIVDIKALQAHDLTPVRSSIKVLYALEMNQSWFAKQDIRVGDKVEMLP